jgi:aminomethyltransferase (EC 2.1.2.10)
VTSGGISPVLNRGISLGYVEREYAKEGEEVTVDVRGRGLKGRVTKVPFV